MKIIKRSICISIVAIMLLMSLTSCGFIFDLIKTGNEQESNESDVVDNTTSGSDNETESTIETDKYGQPVYADPTAGYNGNGQTINILVRSGDQYIREWYVDQPASNIDQKVYTRNQAVQSALNIRLNYIPQSEGADNEEFFQKVTNVGFSGLGGIDVVSAFAAYATNQDAMSFYVNWFDQAKLPYLNLDNQYWNQNFKNDAQAFGKLYVNVGDMNLSVYDRCMVVFFNKALAESYIEDSNGDEIDLYELVQSGEWYYDTFYEMIKDVYEDTGTNVGERDNNDFYGVTGILGSEAPDSFLYSFGGAMTTTADDGTHSLASDSAFVKLGEIYESMIEFWYSPGAIMPTSSYTNYDIFTGGYALFTVDVVWHYNEGLVKLHAMSDGYGIIPMPKYNEDQDNYITGVQDAHNVLSIMDCGASQDFEMISAVLEKMAHYSYSNVRSYYVENILKSQNMDYNSATCFNYVLNGIRWDFADVYNTSLGKLRESLWRSPFKANSGFDARWQTYSKKYNNALADLDAWLIAQN